MAKDLQEEITTMIYNYGLGVGPDSGTLAVRIISKVKHRLTKRAADGWKCPKCGKQNGKSEFCEACGYFVSSRR